jgi:excisionase family DNA binding protein
MSDSSADPRRRKTNFVENLAEIRRAQFLTPTQVADRLLVAPVTVRLWASKGLLPSVTTPGGHRRFRSADVEAFIAAHQQQPASTEAPPSRILIIDDDEQFSSYLTVLISKRAPGVFVDVAHDGFAAGIKCEAMRPDVVTLDLQMPKMNGFEVCALLRSMFGKTKPRIVALTGLATEDNVRRVLAAGADACLAKTATTDTLLGELRLLSVRSP